MQIYNGFSKHNAELISDKIESFYKIRVVILPQIDLPKAAFIKIKSPRYRADSIIKIQKRNSVNKVDYILGITANDISITKKNSDGTIKKPTWKYNDFGIMGLGYCPGNSCIISSFRLKSKDNDQFLLRLQKVTLHELGHNLGLKHCSNKQCLMTSAVEKIQTIDNEKLELCANCRMKLD
ncbi:archaemetzincin [Flavobacterium sp. SUN052]|uniref:archaemetzincin n=1 Tax=Flavobacterium sp. SUN052 TaxID=3002441 RepID=UPI00237D926A|nr:archaemetzincin [Flavobacterium sp. SUN052]MEC4005064.1 archaemetzincin [Flavobacterium sp. SUN052]